MNNKATSKRATGTVTLADVAARAGVSAQTVSRAIRTPELVSEVALAKVREAIAQTGYVPNLAASNLASNRSQTIAVLIPALSGSVFNESINGLNEVLTAAGYQIFIGTTDYRPEREEELVRAFLGRRPDGFVIVGTHHTQTASELLKNSGVPVVETWSLSAEPIDSIVGFSNRDAIKAMLEFVLWKGYRHPTLAGSFHAGDSRAMDRLAGFERAMTDMLPGEPLRVVNSHVPTINLETGRNLLNSVLTRHPETDVLMFVSDVFAAGAILECNRRGIQVPQDLAITGFGDLELSEHLCPALTTVAVPNRAIGLQAGELLLRRIRGENRVAEQVDLGFSIVSREST